MGCAYSALKITVNKTYHVMKTRIIILLLSAFAAFGISVPAQAQCKVSATVKHTNVSQDRWYVVFYKECRQEVRLTWYVVYADGSRSDKSSTTFYASSTELQYSWPYYKPVSDIVIVDAEWESSDSSSDSYDSSSYSGTSDNDDLITAFNSQLYSGTDDAYLALALGCGNTTMGYPGARVMTRLGTGWTAYGISASAGYNPSLKSHGGSGFCWSAGMQMYIGNGFMSIDWTQSSFYPEDYSGYDKDYTKGLSASLGYNLFIAGGFGITADAGFKLRPGSNNAHFVWNVGIFWALPFE